jgi:hypothetical protein
MTSFHVLINIADWHDKVERKFIYYIGDHPGEYCESSVLEICQLDIEGSELNTPSDLGVARRWWLEAHGIPIS